MSYDKPVSACICGEISFAELKEAGVTTLEGAEQFGCGITCRLCVPYLLRMIETGETEFAVLESGS